MSTQTLITAAEFEDLAGRLGPSELVRGEVITLSPGGISHSRLIIKLGRALDEWAEAAGKGWVAGGEMGLVVQRKPDTVRGASRFHHTLSRFFTG